MAARRTKATSLLSKPLLISVRVACNCLGTRSTPHSNPEYEGPYLRHQCASAVEHNPRKDVRLEELYRPEDGYHATRYHSCQEAGVVVETKATPESPAP